MAVAKNWRGGRKKLYEDRAEIRCVLSEDDRAALGALVEQLGSSTSRTVSALVTEGLQRADRSGLPWGRRSSGAGQLVTGYVSGATLRELEDLVAEHDSTRALIVGGLVTWGLRHVEPSELPRGRKAAAAAAESDQGELPLAAS